MGVKVLRRDKRRERERLGEVMVRSKLRKQGETFLSCSLIVHSCCSKGEGMTTYEEEMSDMYMYMYIARAEHT